MVTMRFSPPPLRRRHSDEFIFPEQSKSKKADFYTPYRVNAAGKNSDKSKLSKTSAF